MCNQRAGQRRFNSSREVGMQALEHGLRTFPKTFSLFIELTKNFKARFLFCLPALNGGELFFHASDSLLMLSHLLVASLKSGSAMIEFVLEVLRRRPCRSRLVLDSRAGGFYVRNRGIQTAAIFLCGFATNFKTGNFLFQIRDMALNLRRRVLQRLKFRFMRASFGAKFRELPGKSA